jgi:hypothetical protein
MGTGEQVLQIFGPWDHRYTGSPKNLVKPQVNCIQFRLATVTQYDGCSLLLLIHLAGPLPRNICGLVCIKNLHVRVVDSKLLQKCLVDHRWKVFVRLRRVLRQSLDSCQYLVTNCYFFIMNITIICILLEKTMNYKQNMWCIKVWNFVTIAVKPSYN